MPHFLVVLATAIKLKLQEVKGLPMFITKEKGELLTQIQGLTLGIQRVAALL